MLRTELNEMDKQEIIELIDTYDSYVTTFYDYHDSSCTPVCLLEFLYNDYELLKEN